MSRALVIVGLLGVLAGTANADDSSRARIEYREATKLYNLGDYAESLARFKAAYLVVPDPVFLFNIAQCHRQLQQWEPAAKSYRAFLREAPNIAPKARDDVQRLINEMDAAVREERTRKPPTETKAPLLDSQVPPTEVVQKPEPPPVVVVPPPPPRPWFKQPAGMALTFGGIGVAIIGGALLGQSSADDSNSRHASTLPGARNLHDSALTFQSAGFALVGVGAAAAISGAVILILTSRKPHAVTQASR